jgi:hypothetical protein
VCLNQPIKCCVALFVWLPLPAPCPHPHLPQSALSRFASVRFSESSSSKQQTREGIVIRSDTAIQCLRMRGAHQQAGQWNMLGTDNRCKRKETWCSEVHASRPKWHSQWGCSSTGAGGLQSAQLHRLRKCRRTACSCRLQVVRQMGPCCAGKSSIGLW